MILKWIYIAFITIDIGIITIINFRLFSYTSISERTDRSFQVKEVLLQLNYLEREIHNNSADIQMQEVFPEGYIFMNVLYGLTWCELALKDSSVFNIYNKAVAEASIALKKLESNEAKRTFHESLNPQYGIFYQGWTNYLRAKLLWLTKHKKDNLITKNYLITCNMFASVLDSVESPYLETYKGASWPADMFPCIISLKLHDELFQEKYSSTIAQWLHKVRWKLDKKTGLIPHSVESYSGNLIEGARGSSQSLIIRLLVELDTSFANNQYKLFKRKFVDDILGLTVIREYPIGIDDNGDIDSGPVMFGAGSSATIAAIGTARSCDDLKLASALEKTIEVTGMPVSFNEEKKYLLGKLPIADMFIAWSKVSPSFINGQRNNDIKQKYFNRNKFLTISLLIIVILLAPIFIHIYLKQKGGRTIRGQ